VPSNAGWRRRLRESPVVTDAGVSETDAVEQDGVVLRPIDEADLAALLRFRWDLEAVGEYQWFGFRIDDARALERRWQHDGLISSDSASFLAVVAVDGACAGWVTWRPHPFGNFEIGAALFPEYRGRGVGTTAHRLLVDYLFATTTAHRIQAGTEVDNTAERRALERVGFQLEGVQRGVGFRDGEWRDGVMYSRLRSDARPVT
jgi:ribosomal-protein-alanine N-acetyltransferase